MANITEIYRTMIVGGVDPYTIKSMVTDHRNELNAQINCTNRHEFSNAIDQLEEYVLELDKLIKSDEIACL